MNFGRKSKPESDIAIVERFAKEKGLPRPGRLVGGASIYHRMPEQVQVIKGRNVPYQSVGRLAAEAERRGVTPSQLAEELHLQPSSQPTLPARIGYKVAEALHLRTPKA